MSTRGSQPCRRRNRAQGEDRLVFAGVAARIGSVFVNGRIKVLENHSAALTSVGQADNMDVYDDFVWDHLAFARLLVAEMSTVP